jgi:5-hydroxyisourate hydrolase
MSPITTHVLDTARGCPAAGIPIRLEQQGGDGRFAVVGSGITDADGRVKDLLAPGALTVGTYRITFETGGYLTRTGDAGFYPEVPVIFRIEQPQEHYHVPLLLSPFGYSTYRGS